ncbi:MAG TPA: glycerol-3-phosphate 1-O-acyltransferase PlsY [Thermomicrobiales bacterium]|nr:glycerol-3-phosphate 1-O-acyltransferase PlsY [Thermomicrobiales bacterium]
MPLIGSLGLILGAYIVGGIPWGVVLGRVFKGVDVRQHGSGATGATNALRILGWKLSVAVFVLDFLKGLLPVALARSLDSPGWVIGAVAVVSVAGHCWSPFIGFRGGKGMATGGGAAVALMPWLFFMLVPMIIVVAITRYVSLASLSAAASGSALVIALALSGSFPSWWAVGVVTVATIIVIQHRGNIARLLNGTERKFGNREHAGA